MMHTIILSAVFIGSVVLLYLAMVRLLKDDEVMR